MILYFIVTTIVLAIVYRLLIEYLNLPSEIPITVFLGFVLITTGLWTRLTAEDYYIDKQGRRKYLDIENELFFIRMRTWGILLPLVGVGFLFYGIFEAFTL